MTSIPTTTAIPAITLTTAYACRSFGFGIFQLSDDDTTASRQPRPGSWLPEHRHRGDLRQRGGHWTRHRRVWHRPRRAVHHVQALGGRPRLRRHPGRLRRQPGGNWGWITWTSTSSTGPRRQQTCYLEILAGAGEAACRRQSPDHRGVQLPSRAPAEGHRPGRHGGRRSTRSNSTPPSSSVTLPLSTLPMGIVTEAWSPLPGRGAGQIRLLPTSRPGTA